MRTDFKPHSSTRKINYLDFIIVLLNKKTYINFDQTLNLNQILYCFNTQENVTNLS